MEKLWIWTRRMIVKMKIEQRKKLINDYERKKTMIMQSKAWKNLQTWNKICTISKILFQKYHNESEISTHWFRFYYDQKNYYFRFIFSVLTTTISIFRSNNFIYYLRPFIRHFISAFITHRLTEWFIESDKVFFVLKKVVRIWEDIKKSCI